MTPLQELEYAGDTPVDHGPSQFIEEAPPRHISDEGDGVLSPLNPPRPRQPSRMSESSGALSVVISTAAKLTRSNTSVSTTSAAVQHTPAVTPDDEVQQGQQRMVASEHPLSSRPPAVHEGRLGGDEV